MIRTSPGRHRSPRKPCRGTRWTVRLGADIGITCGTCKRRVLLDRSTAETDQNVRLLRAREDVN
jgi:hypothetical protein